MKRANSTMLAYLMMVAPAATEGADINETISQCIRAQQDGDVATAKAAALSITSTIGIEDVRSRVDAGYSLESVTGERWTYFPDERRMLPYAFRPILADVKSAGEQAAMAFEVLNVTKVAQDTYSACISLHEADQVAAMTNSVCQSSFIVNGHPSLPAKEAFINEFQQNATDRFAASFTPQIMEYLTDFFAHVVEPRSE